MVSASSSSARSRPARASKGAPISGADLRRWAWWLGVAVIALLPAILSFAHGATGEVPGAKRFALVIGNAQYKDAALTNPINDARDLAATLRELGFNVTLKENLGAQDMKRAIREFGDRLVAENGVGLFYFAGHGVQIKGSNYLLPVGPNYQSENDIEDEAVDANTILRRMEEARNPLNIVILDACRNNPFARGLKNRSLSRGLARMEAPSGTLVAFATAPGTEASDGSGKNGLYTKHLIANIRTPGLTIEQVFKRVREGVERESNAAQSPREESSLKGEDFYFVPRSLAARPAAQPAAVDPAAVELAYWDSVKASTNAGDFEAYLTQYPNGRFAALAKNRVATLKEATQVAARQMNTGHEAPKAPAAAAAAMPAAAAAMPAASAAAPPPAAASGHAPAPAQVAAAMPAPRPKAKSGFSLALKDEEPAPERIDGACRQRLRGKRVQVALEAQPQLTQAFTRRLVEMGLTPVAKGADFQVRGALDAQSGVHAQLGINEVNVRMALRLTDANGREWGDVSTMAESYAGRDLAGVATDLVKENAERVLAGLWRDYCAAH